ncbi:DEDD exonuclease domain-containing protein [Actinotalea sp.]|uniref:DEDD exonuclease domain-containing protein n=1 Tax=Actinotalea sp. TaxID=1872145 RepID=UPI00356A81AC
MSAPAPAPPRGAPRAVQPTLEEIGTPLHEVTFVVVDLETTGGSPATSAITEIGAVKVRGGQVLGEFGTLVDPGGPVPAFISTLTGITTSMLVGAPRIGEVLPSFLEFAHDAVLVAHNARFDVGFLKAAAAELGHPWPGPQVLDTVALARRAVTRDEVPNHKLSTLAAFFGATVTPNHRALEDARATVDVLHALLARLGPLGITHLEDLATATDPVPDARRRKRHLADGLPDAPGVYQFRDVHGEILYVGTATSIRRRVRSYFTAAEQRKRMNEMVGLAHDVVPIVCATVLEAQVRELRLIAQHAPRYNRRSRFPERMPWVRLTVEPYPRLSLVREVRPGGGPGPLEAEAHIGPFASRSGAEQAIAALHASFPIRQCSGRLPARPAAGASPCALAGMGRCGAPCTGGQDASGYAEVTAAVRAAMQGDPSVVVTHHAERIARLVAAERFEEAAAVRDRLQAFLRAAARAQRSRRLGALDELVAARPHEGGWEIVVVRHGRLGATTRTPPGADPRESIPALLSTAEHVQHPVLPATSAHPEETDLVLGWLEQDGVRLVQVGAGWACPVRGAEAFRSQGATAAAVADTARTLRTA